MVVFIAKQYFMFSGKLTTHSYDLMIRVGWLSERVYLHAMHVHVRSSARAVCVAILMHMRFLADHVTGTPTNDIRMSVHNKIQKE